jgi:hypothetical protein
LQCRIPAIGIAVAVIFKNAPRVILRVNGLFEANDYGENSQNAQHKHHGRLLITGLLQKSTA